MVSLAVDILSEGNKIAKDGMIICCLQPSCVCQISSETNKCNKSIDSCTVTNDHEDAKPRAKGP